jgi:GTP-binding protein
LLTKSDKLSRGAASAALQATRKALAELYPQAGIQLFSAPQRLGVAEAQGRIGEWLGLEMATSE